MRRALRENAPCAAAVAAAGAAMAWLGLYGFAWNDYEVEAEPALQALVHGHLATFLSLAPAYGGSLIERAPFALLAAPFGGGPLAVYRLVSLPCLLAAAVLAVWLVARMRAVRQPWLARAVVAGVCVANPLTLRALELGHPEELLGGALCVAAVLLAAGPDGGRPLAAGLALGAAIANKEWALLALPAVLLALPANRRATCLAACTVTASAILAPLLIFSSGGFVAATRASASSAASAIFQPWQAWWFFGHHGTAVHGLFGAPKPGYRTAPAWTGAVSRPAILAAGLALGLVVWQRMRAARLGVREALLALAVALALRFLLDTWDAVYYPLPFLLSLAAWEAHGPRRSTPVLALAASVGFWISFQWLPAHGLSADGQAATFLAWTVPLTAWLALRLLRRETDAPPVRAQETTVSSLGRLVSTS